MRLQDRAERISSEQVAETFVSVGPLLDLLSSQNNQIMYGRRGTGKTHALRFFQVQRNLAGDIALYLDAQNIGSNGSIYNDSTIPVSERATRLLVDVCSFVHHELLEIFTAQNSLWDLSKAAPILDRFVDHFTETRVSGPLEVERNEKSAVALKSGTSVGVSGGFTRGPAFDGRFGQDSSNSAEDSSRVKVTGTEDCWIDFNYFSQAMRALAEFVKPKRLWLLIDEWTTVPSDIQPYLADLIRRAMFSVSNITVKVAAIEHRANFKLDFPNEDYIGFELGADISASINLDDYLVIDNNESRAKDFFRTFIGNHASVVATELGLNLGSANEIVGLAFTQDNVFTEFVRATEGVPRDAMHVLALAAQRANAVQISMPVIRAASYAFFQTEKYNAIQSNNANSLLLDWIRDEVISNRRTRAFLLPVNTDDVIIDRLFDRRALHILNRNRSAAHRPGERFVVYKLDYGLYVDLASTDKYPSGLLIDEALGEDVDFDVPLDDARSYRRAILDLGKFYQAHPELVESMPIPGQASLL